MCQAIFHGCVMPLGDTAGGHLLHDSVIHKFCDALTCAVAENEESRNSGSSRNVYGSKRALYAGTFLDDSALLRKLYVSAAPPIMTVTNKHFT